MTSFLIGVVAVVVAYLCGSIPTGFWIGKLVYGIDIRELGSKSTGATNVLRTLGKTAAAIVPLVDLLKGVAGIVAARAIASHLPAMSLDWLTTFAGFAAIIGHSRSIWLRFAGGKSAATGLGVLLAMAWPVGVGAVLAFGTTLAVTRIVSISSIVGALSSVALMQYFGQPLPYVLLTVAGGIYVIWRHKTNIQRLVAGTEPRIGRMHANGS